MRDPQNLQDASQQSNSERRRARARLQGLLARRPYTKQEVLRKLSSAGFSKNIVQNIVDDAEASGWLNDQTFAKLWVEDRTANKPRGKALLRRELRNKGVADQKIEQAISDADVNEEALALRMLKEQQGRYQGDDPGVQQRKLKNFLQRRGFSFEVIRRALRQIGDEDA